MFYFFTICGGFLSWLYFPFYSWFSDRDFCEFLEKRVEQFISLLYYTHYTTRPEYRWTFLQLLGRLRPKSFFYFSLSILVFFCISVVTWSSGASHIFSNTIFQKNRTHFTVNYLTCEWRRFQSHTICRVTTFWQSNSHIT